MATVECIKYNEDPDETAWMHRLLYVQVTYAQTAFHLKQISLYGW